MHTLLTRLFSNLFNNNASFLYRADSADLCTLALKHSATQTKLIRMLGISIFLSALNSVPLAAQEFNQKLDLQLRADDRSSRDIRYQYRMRYRPQVQFDNTWSVNAFAVTGDEFGSSHNTLDDGSADYVYLRRLFVRHEGDYGKTEVGVIPTYKGRVSSSGLSKDGWIKGARHVRNLGKDRLEVVVGQLTSLDPSRSHNAPNDLDYIEIEYSAQIDDVWSYELSAERMTEANFVRTELRYAMSSSTSAFAELVTRLDESRVKTVLGFEGEFIFNRYPVEYFAHYSYVSKNFGLRAELTEDFLGTGSGFSAEFSGDIPQSKFGWFMRYDAIKSRTRVLAGVTWSL